MLQASLIEYDTNLIEYALFGCIKLFLNLAVVPLDFDQHSEQLVSSRYPGNDEIIEQGQDSIL